MPRATGVKTVSLSTFKQGDYKHMQVDSKEGGGERKRQAERAAEGAELYVNKSMKPNKMYAKPPKSFRATYFQYPVTQNSLRAK